MESNQIDQDMFGQTVQSYDNLKKRAEHVFYVRGQYFSQLDYIDDIDIDMYEVNITMSYYSCNDRDFMYVSFPSSYLLMADEELNVIFKKEKEDQEEQNRIEKEKARETDRLRHERFERQQLAELIKKYGIPQGE